MRDKSSFDTITTEDHESQIFVNEPQTFVKNVNEPQTFVKSDNGPQIFVKNTRKIIKIRKTPKRIRKKTSRRQK